MRLCNKQSGFTLIELIVIIAILAVFAGIAVPNFLSYMPKSRLNGAARQVMGDLMAARMKAVSQNCDVAVTFASGNPEYEIWTDSDNDDIEDSGEVITKNIQSNYHDVTIDTDRNIEFSPRGTANSYGNVNVKLTNSASSRLVKVNITGRVMIE
ncbi:GspH/FimT family pseudopilin [candidate division WOR-3 bacterium]|nr:GspH/FimT family pseudopilin [candidate division WOR-3 bacterium]